MDVADVFKIYRPLFKKCIFPTKLLPHLLKQESFVNVKDHCADLTIAEFRDHVQAADKLLSLIEANNDGDKYDRLIIALKDAGYEDLAENLEGIPEIEDVDVLKTWMEEYLETLETIAPNQELLSKLRSKGMLSSPEVKGIIQAEKEQGTMRGFFYMFAVVVRKKGWAELFIEALKDNGLTRQAHVLETGDRQGYDDEASSGGAWTLPTETLSSQGTTASQQSMRSDLQCLSPVGAECEQSGSASPVVSAENNGLPQSEAMMPIGSTKSQDIAMDSDEEAEMLEEAIRKSMTYSASMETDNEETLPKLRTQESSRNENNKTEPEEATSSGFETSPKKRIAKISNIPAENLDSSNVEQGAVPKTYSKEWTLNINPEKHKLESGTPSMEEMRRKRLAKFAGETIPVNQASSSMTKVRGVGGSDGTEERKAASFSREQACTLSESLDLTVDSSLRGAFESRDALSQEEMDFQFASQLQEEEYSGQTNETTDDNNTLTCDWNDLGGASARMRNTVPERMNISGSEMKKQELKLRKYQEELAAPAKRGINTVIVAPTGSGKTIVALDIARDHFDNADIGTEPKVGFIVPTIPLVEQQKKQFLNFNALADKRTIAISGDSTLTKRASFAMQLEECDIAVFTPQLLVDAFRKKEISSLFIFTLLIFDECHHSMKDHPYNVIMSIYFEEKKRRRHTLLPQIVGLTASVGVGKADSVDKTETHIITLCASLDAEIVTVTEHVEELERNANNPIEITEPVRSRAYDPFKQKVMEIMEDIEGIIRHASEKITFEKSTEFQRGIKPPAGKDTELYTQWISTVDQLVTELEENQQRTFVECIKYLKVYNKALLVNADCRTKDAFELIDKEIQTIVFPGLTDSGRIDKHLHRMFEDSKEKLMDHVKDEAEHFPNPKLTKLKEILEKEYAKNDDSRGIIFCKTRALTLALQNWIKEDKDIKHLNPRKLVGTHTPESRGGMTLRNIEDALIFFKDGTHKVIIATTVAEEGLDIKKCNLVIRYEHVTNEIARTQAKGRGRAKNAKYILIGEVGRGAIEKDRINRMREKMMKEALNNIVDLIKHNKEEYWARVKEQQDKLAIDREMKKIGQSQKRVINKNNKEENFEMRCQKCNKYACFASDIRKIEGSHHVVIDKEFEDVVQVEVYPVPPTYKHFTQKGRLYCKHCSQEWGTQADYKKAFFYVLNIKGFMFVDSNRRKGKFKKWKDVPFQVPILSANELRGLVPTNEITEELEHILEIDGR